MFNRIKSLLRKEAVKTANDNIKGCTGEKMKEHIKSWWDIYCNNPPWLRKDLRTLPVAAVSTAYLAQLVGNEFKYEVGDDFLNSQIQKHFLPKLDEITQKTLVGGYAVIKPYITRESKIFFDVGYSYNFIPITFSESGQITEGTFIDKTIYEGRLYFRYEHHRFSGNVHRVTNTVYHNKREIPLETVPRWAELFKEGEINTEVPMIVTYRTPYANNISLSSELPVSMFANSACTLKLIDEAYNSYFGEMKKAEMKIFADRTLFDNNGKLSDDFYVNFEGDTTNGINSQLYAFTPAAREEQYRNALNSQLRLYEIEIGLSSGTLTFDGAKGRITATQVLSEDKTTYNTVKQMQKQLGSVLLPLTEIIYKLSKEYGIKAQYSEPTVSSYAEPVIEFGDSVFEDTGTEFCRRMQMVQSGMLKAELLIAWYFGVSEDEARTMLPEMTRLFGDS